MRITTKIRGGGLGALKHLAFKNTLEMFQEDFCSALGACLSKLKKTIVKCLPMGTLATPDEKPSPREAACKLLHYKTRANFREEPKGLMFHECAQLALRV